MRESEAYIQFCENNFRRPVDVFKMWESSIPELPPIGVMIWRGHPEPGCLTAVTYGLSRMRKKEWIKAAPEMMIRLDTDNIQWALGMAYLVEAFREEKSFGWQTVLTMEEPIADESEMRGFFTFAPPLIEGEVAEYQRGNDIPIILSGFYPIYLGERDILPLMGLKAFWHHELYDPFSVTRPDLSKL